jgi:hypothetical protein
MEKFKWAGAHMSAGHSRFDRGRQLLPARGRTNSTSHHWSPSIILRCP